MRLVIGGILVNSDIFGKRSLKPAQYAGCANSIAYRSRDTLGVGLDKHSW